MENKSTPFKFESFDLISYIIKRIKPLVIITLIAAVTSVVVALLINERYKSTVIFFPASSSSVSQDLLRDNLSSKDILKFGEEEEVEQLLQVLQSDEIRNRIIEKFNLMEHYEIDTDQAYPITELNRKYDNNISFKQTEYMSIKIEVLDEDAQLAADIANNIAALVDTAMNRMQKSRAFKALKIAEREYFELKHQIETLEDSLAHLRSLGIVDYESQAEVYNQAYAEAITAGNTSGANKLEKKLEVLYKHGGTYVSIRDFLEFEKKQLSSVKARYAEANVDYEQNLPHTFIVNNAIKAEKKSYPVRWLICSVSTISTFIFALLLLLIFDYGREKYFSKS